MVNFLMAIIVDTFVTVKETQMEAPTVPWELKTLGDSFWARAAGGGEGIADETELRGMIRELKHSRAAQAQAQGSAHQHDSAAAGGAHGLDFAAGKTRGRVLITRFADGKKEYISAEQLEQLLAVDFGLAQASEERVGAARSASSGRGILGRLGTTARPAQKEAADLARGVAAAVRTRALALLLALRMRSFPLSPCAPLAFSCVRDHSCPARLHANSTRLMCLSLTHRSPSLSPLADDRGGWAERSHRGRVRAGDGRGLEADGRVRACVSACGRAETHQSRRVITRRRRRPGRARPAHLAQRTPRTFLHLPGNAAALIAGRCWPGTLPSGVLTPPSSPLSSALCDSLRDSGVAGLLTTVVERLSAVEQANLTRFRTLAESLGKSGELEAERADRMLHRVLNLEQRISAVVGSSRPASSAASVSQLPVRVGQVSPPQ